jgi:hypothetical protein
MVLGLEGLTRRGIGVGFFMRKGLGTFSSAHFVFTHVALRSIVMPISVKEIPYFLHSVR